MNKRLIFILFGFIIFFACNETSNDLIAEHVIKIPSQDKALNETPIKLSDVIDSSYAIRLETNEDCILGEIDKIKIFNNRIFILNKRQSKGVFEFNMKGKFIRRFGKLGQGPGEYTAPNSFTINEGNNKLLIADRSGTNILAYNLKGEFLGSKRNKSVFTDFDYDKVEDVFVFDVHNKRKESSGNGTDFFSIITRNENGKVVSELLKTSNNIGNYISYNNLSVSEENVLYNQPFTNEIYQIHKGNAIPLIKINFEEQTLPLKKYNSLDDLKKELDTNNFSYFSNIRGYSIINNNLLFSVQQGKYVFKYIYSFDSKLLYSISTIKDLDIDGFGFIGQYKYSYEKYAVYYAQPDWIMSMTKNYKSKIIIDFINDIKLMDNPVLIFNRLKDNL